MKREFKLELDGLKEKIKEISKDVKYVGISWKTIKGEWWQEYEVFWYSFASPMFILKSDQGIDEFVDYYTKTYNDPNVDKATLIVREE